MSLSLLFCEIMYFWPMIVPYIQFDSIHLLIKFGVITDFKGNKSQLWRTFNDRLTFTQQWEYAIVAFISSELFGSCNNRQISTVSNKYCALTWSNVYFTIICVIDINIGGNIKDKILWLFAIINVVLLTFYWIDFFNLELICLIFESIIIRIVLFLNGFRL